MLKKAGKLVGEGPDVAALQELRDKKLIKKVNDFLRPLGYILAIRMSDDGVTALGVHVERWNVDEPFSVAMAEARLHTISEQLEELVQEQRDLTLKIGEATAEAKYAPKKKKSKTK